MNTTTAHRPVTVNPNRPLAEAAGQPATFRGWDGAVREGVTEVNRDGRLIVRFADGGWAYASVEFVGGEDSHLDDLGD